LRHDGSAFDRPTSGAIRVRERNLAELEADELARYRRETVGMVFQSFNLLPRMTLEENVELPLRPPPKWIATTGNPALAKRLSAWGLPHEGSIGRANSPAARSNAGLWRAALVNRPAILFADEPTGNLDSVKWRTNPSSATRFRILSE